MSFKSHGNSSPYRHFANINTANPLPITKLSPNPVIIQISKYSSIGMETVQRYREMQSSFRTFQQNFASLICFLTGGEWVSIFFFIVLFDNGPFVPHSSMLSSYIHPSGVLREFRHNLATLKCQLILNFDRYLIGRISLIQYHTSGYGWVLGCTEVGPPNFYMGCIEETSSK